MSRQNQLMHLPLITSGLPDHVANWLRTAGIPTARFQTSPALFRYAQSAAGRIVVFDARSASGRLDARTARECGAEVVNMADLLKEVGDIRRGAQTTTTETEAANNWTSNCALFLDRLKSKIESVGGFWLRLSDYPFPYQNAVCRFSNWDNNLFAEEFPFAGSPMVCEGLASCEGNREWISECYESGLPVFLHETESRRLAETEAETERFDWDDYPLTWQTTVEEFARWRNVRGMLQTVAWKKGTTYQIGCSGDLAGFRPMMELWLGAHVASFPLFRETITLREEGIAFVQQQRRHVGGLAAQWCDERALFNLVRPYVNQPA